MDKVDDQLYRTLLEGQVKQERISANFFGRPLPRCQSIQERECYETRDDGGYRNAPSSTPHRALHEALTVSVPTNGIIQVEFANESIPGITFSRRCSKGGYTLQIDYVHADSSLCKSPLVPGLVVRRINDQEMVRQSPQDARRELMNERFSKTCIQVFGYIFKAHKPLKSTKLGLVLKDSTSAEGVFLSSIKADSIFGGTDLKEGLRVISINKRPCPKDILKAIKRLQKSIGRLELIAVDTASAEDRRENEINANTIPRPRLKSTENVVHQIQYDRRPNNVNNNDALPKESKIEPFPLPPQKPTEELRQVQNVEQLNSARRTEKVKRIPCPPPKSIEEEVRQVHCNGPSNVISLVHVDEANFPQRKNTRRKDLNSIQQINGSAIDFTASQTTTQQKVAIRDFGANREPENLEALMQETSPGLRQSISKQSKDYPEPEGVHPVRPKMVHIDDSMLCRAFRDETTEFVQEHTDMLDKAVRKLLGEERANMILGERECAQWRMVDVRKYSQIKSLPSIVVGSVDQPTPPMVVGLAPPAKLCSPLCKKVINQEMIPLIGVAVPQELAPNHHDASKRRGLASYIAAEELTSHDDSYSPNHQEPGLVVKGLEMSFTEKTVFIAGNPKGAKGGGDSIVMAMLLFADNALLQMDKMCF